MISLMNGYHCGPINIGNPCEFTNRQLAELVRAKVNPELPVIEKPLPQDDPLQRKPVIDLAQRELGWHPMVPLEQGLDATIAWFSEFLSSQREGISDQKQAGFS
jgi:UDP-glucuronate decarboxylase